MAKHEMSDWDDAIKGPAVGMRGLVHASLEDVTVIDFDEFEAARRDPKVAEFLGEAKAEGQKIESEGRKLWGSDEEPGKPGWDSSDFTGQ
jgi:hypothetical protein